MAISFMLRWWYGRGWAWAVEAVGRQLNSVNELFAAKVLLKTWFSPWKQITTTYAHETILQKLLDKTISRVIGGFIRSGALLLAGLYTLFIGLWGALLLISWPFLPLLPVVFVILTISGVTL